MKLKYGVYWILTVVLSFAVGFLITTHRQKIMLQIGLSQKPLVIISQQKIIPPLVQTFLERQMQRQIEIREILYANDIQDLKNVDWLLVPRDWLNSIEGLLQTLPYDIDVIYADFKTEKVLHAKKYLPLFWSYPLTLVEENEKLSPPHVLAYKAGNNMTENPRQSDVQILTLVSLNRVDSNDPFLNLVLDEGLQKRWLQLIPYASSLQIMEEKAIPFYQKPSHLRTLPLEN